MSPAARNRRHSSPLNAAVKGWAAEHLRCLVEALGRLHRRWLASLLTALVIGITLALPAGLYVLIKNLDGLTYSWQSSVQVSVYLKRSVNDHGARQLARRIGQRDRVADVQYISPAEGLDAFRKASGFGDALAALAGNPLPPVVAVTPDPDLPHGQVTALVGQLRELRGVQRAELDQAWLRRLHAILAVLERAAWVIGLLLTRRRLHAILAVLERAAWVIGLLLSAAIVFIVGNTIRLDIENRREEIEVMKLIGASDAFIRRPFLYSGAWYGLAGAVFALILLGVCFLALATPLGALTHSYNGAFELSGLGWSGSFWLIVGGVALGWSGCALTISRRLRAIEPG